MKNVSRTAVRDSDSGPPAARRKLPKSRGVVPGQKNDSRLREENAKLRDALMAALEHCLTGKLPRLLLEQALSVEGRVVVRSFRL